MTKNFTYYHECFKSVRNALDFLEGNGIISQNKICVKCNSIAYLKIVAKNNKEKIIYRCSKKMCQKRISVLSTKIEIHKYLFLLYCILLNMTYYQIKCLVDNVTNETISSARKVLRAEFKKFNNDVLLGGLGKVVEADETVLCRRKTISSPTDTDDETPDTVWIFGMIDNTPHKNIFVRKVENRQAPTLTDVIGNRINVFSLFCTDGYPSYPIVARNLDLEHKIVNHSEGFVAPDGTHTNNIESLWAILKSEMRKQHGVKREEIDEWSEEFSFRQNFLRGNNIEDFSEIFMRILSGIFR
ncbi:hypothetical protein EQH57_0633 [Dictyocoela roeselum]|nr:hypothetical protein EQH57_0633 [Dictyocoela roeselum]